jgi:SAM-dependent methyltransferase
MQSSSGPRRRADASAAMEQYRRRASRYDIELLPFEPVRVDAIALLDLSPGQVVLDVGCGTGLSFEGLKQKVGPEGRIVGIEPSPDMLALARERVVLHGWQGIELFEAWAADAPLHGRADAALFHFTHDVLRHQPSIDHILKHLKRGARVVATGLQWAPPWMAATNLFVLGAALYSVSRLTGLEQPWDLLGKRLRDVKVETRGFGGIYLMSGRLA